jgi:hypothetical protein
VAPVARNRKPGLQHHYFELTQSLYFLLFLVLATAATADATHAALLDKTSKQTVHLSWLSFSKPTEGKGKSIYELRVTINEFFASVASNRGVRCVKQKTGIATPLF